MKARKTRKRLPVGFTERADGTLMYRFTVEGQRTTVYGKTVKECREKEDIRRQDIKQGTYRSGKAQSFSEFSSTWLEAKEGTVKETTIRTNRIILNLINRTEIDAAGHVFGELKIEKIEAQNVRSLQKAMAKNTSTRVVNDSIGMVRAVLESAIAEHFIIWNPAKNIRALARTEERAADTIHRALTRDETGIFLEAAKDCNAWHYNLFVFLLNTGLRIGEAAALMPADIAGDEIRVRRTVTRTESGAYTIGDDTKTAAGRRNVPMNAEAERALNAQRTIERLFRSEKVIGMQTPIFRAQRGGILHATLVNESIARICKNADIDRFTVHAFRDTFATRCIESGMQVKTLQSILGHTDINMTLSLYAHCMKETKQEQLKKVSFM